MNMSIYTLGFVLMGAAFLTLGAGCLNPSDRIVAELAEKAIERSGGGEFEVDIDSSGGEVTIKGEDGSIATGGTDTRPDSVPEDMPNLSGAENFFWMGVSGNGALSYEIVSNDYRAICAEQLAILAKSGWEVSTGFELEADNVMMKTLLKPGVALTVTCAGNSDDRMVSVSMNKAPQE